MLKNLLITCCREVVLVNTDSETLLYLLVQFYVLLYLVVGMDGLSSFLSFHLIQM